MYDHHSHDHRDAAANFGPTFAIATALNLGLVAVQVFYGVVARLPARMKWTPKCFIVGKWALWARSAHPNAGLSTAKSARTCRSSRQLSWADHQSQNREGVSLTIPQSLLSRADEVIE